MAPFTSSGWYFRGATAFLLDRGKISWDDILFVFNSTMHLPSDAFAEAIGKVQAAFERLPGNTRPNQPTLSKFAINAAVGAMENLDSCVTWHCISSRCEEDVSKFMPVGEIYDNGVRLDVFDKTHNLSNESYKPIRDQVLQMEHMKIAYALEFLESCKIPRIDIKFLRTDAIILSTTKKKCSLLSRDL